MASEDAEIYALVLRARRNASHRRRLLRITVLVGVGAALALLLVLWPRRPRLRFEVDGASARENAWIAAGPAQRATLTFSDGSRVELEPSTRARVAEVGHKGARVIVETGLAGLRVAQRTGASWSLSAGPFEIALGAAHCDVLWEPELESLEIVTYEGRARVSGPVVGDGRMIERGQRLSVGVREQRATISTVETAEYSGVAPSLGLDPLEASDPASPAGAAPGAEVVAAPAPSASETAGAPRAAASAGP